MKHTYILPILLLCLIWSCNQGNKSSKTDSKDSVSSVVPTSPEEEQNLSEVITRFARAYASKDNAKANQLIHPDLGIYIIYRPGAVDNFVKMDSLDFQAPIPSFYAYTDLEHDYALTYDKLPTIDCGDFTWDKVGFICDTTSRPQQLLNIAKFANEFNEGEYTDADLQQLENAGKQSFRVIITAEEPLIFHVQHYQGKWYVSLLDRAYANCDA